MVAIVLQHLQWIRRLHRQRPRIKFCQIPSVLCSASTGVCSPASRSDGAITTHPSSKSKSGSTQPVCCRNAGPWAWMQVGSDHPLDARSGFLRAQGAFCFISPGQDSDQGNSWTGRVAAGGHREKDRMCRNRQWLQFSLCVRVPAVASSLVLLTKVSAKNPLVASPPQASHDWHRVILSYDSAGGESVQRSNAGKWLGTRRQTHTHMVAHSCTSLRRFT